MRCAVFVGIYILITASSAARASSQAKPTAPPQTKPAAPARLSITVLVTAMDGKPLPEIWVKASGPVDREGPTDASGTVFFNNVTPGSYRLRFEHEKFVTLEKEVAVAAGRPVKTTVSLNAAPPPPPPPPAPAPKVDPPPAAAPPLNHYEPSSVVVLDFLDDNFIGRVPIKRSPMGCTASSTSTLIQLRDPLAEHTHSDVDETLYVVAGEGTAKIGERQHAMSSTSILAIPRGVPHSIARRGSNPLIFVSTLSGQPCQPK
jgi:mannose-6-phosphate isomerase-like protein (cupin superfamily)